MLKFIKALVNFFHTIQREMWSGVVTCVLCDSYIDNASCTETCATAFVDDNRISWSASHWDLKSNHLCSLFMRQLTKGWSWKPCLSCNLSLTLSDFIYKIVDILKWACIRKYSGAVWIRSNNVILACGVFGSMLAQACRREMRSNFQCPSDKLPVK